MRNKSPKNCSNNIKNRSKASNIKNRSKASNSSRSGSKLKQKADPCQLRTHSGLSDMSIGYGHLPYLTKNQQDCQ